MEKLFVFYRFLQLLAGIFFRIILPGLAMLGIFVISIRALIDTNWLQWLVIIIFVLGFFYSFYLQICEYVQKETTKAVEKLEKQKAEIAKGNYKAGMHFEVPTLKEGIWNWTKALFWVGLFLLSLKYF